MADLNDSDATYTLQGLVEGDGRTFPVDIPRTADVHQLRQLIHRVTELDAFRSLDLTLLKVCHDYSSSK